VKVDPKTAHAIAQGRMTAVLRTRKLERQREPVQFERARGEDDAGPKHADDLTVLDTKCHVRVLEQRDLEIGELTDVDAKLLGHRSLFMLKLAMGEEWKPRRRMWLGSLGRLTADTETRLECAREIRALQRQLDALDRKLQSAA
jgi:hypothetical protein